jgi:hypothetical protein
MAFSLIGVFNSSAVSPNKKSNSQSAASTSISPTSINGCFLWLDAADSASIVFSGSNVTQWNDKSNSGYNFTQGTTASQPTYSAMANGKNAINLTTSKYMENTTIPFPTNYTVFAIGYTSQSGYARILHGYPSSEAYFFMGTGDRNTQYASFVGNGTWNDVTTNSPATSVTSLCMMELTNNNTSTGLIPYLNGTAQTSKNGTTVTFTGLTIGVQGNNKLQPWNGYVSEILIYNYVLPAGQRQQVEGYLAWKWSIQTSLPTSHSYYSAAPTSSSVANITNIGSNVFLGLTIASPTTTIMIMSSDGKYGIIAPTTTTLYISSNYGNTWTSVTKPNASAAYSVGMSGSGKYCVLPTYGGGVWYSTNYGITGSWIQSNASTGINWNTAVSNELGDRWIITTGNTATGLYYSTNYGATWNVSNKTTDRWDALAMTPTGNIAVAAKGGNFVALVNAFLYSTDYGVTWTGSTTNLTSVTTLGGASGYLYFNSISISDDGKYCVAASPYCSSGSSGVYYSTNYGVTWTQSTMVSATTSLDWNRCVSSNDGKYVIITTWNAYGSSNTGIWTSSNYGVSFTKNTNLSTLYLHSFAASRNLQYFAYSSPTGNLYYGFNPV